jgi:hypothetical protein
MAVSALFDPRSRSGADSVPPRFQFSGRDGSYAYVVSVRDQYSGQYAPQYAPIPFGAKVVVDFRRIEGGWFCFSPFDDSKLIPLPYSAAEAATAAGAKPGPDYSMVARLPVLLQQHGLAQWTVGGVIAQNAVARLRLLYQNAAAAARNDLPVLALLPSKQIEIRSRNNERHFAPELSIVGWVKRNDDTFGAPAVPPPLPILPPTAAAPLLTEEAANDEAPPWETPGAPAATATQVDMRRPVTTAANDPAAIADDVFAQMTPVVTKQGRPNF